MNDPKLKKLPFAKTGMLVRRPVAEVFAAFIDPEVTTQFWFTKSSGRPCAAPREEGSRRRLLSNRNGT
jgi:uncharacterized protein YndB with AHSA1/START domain